MKRIVCTTTTRCPILAVFRKLLLPSPALYIRASPPQISVSFFLFFFLSSYISDLSCPTPLFINMSFHNVKQCHPSSTFPLQVFITSLDESSLPPPFIVLHDCECKRRDEDLHWRNRHLAFMAFLNGFLLGLGLMAQVSHLTSLNRLNGSRLTY